jgi:hypothetical protein
MIGRTVAPFRIGCEVVRMPPGWFGRASNSMRTYCTCDPRGKIIMSLDTLVMPAEADLEADFEVDVDRELSSLYYISAPDVPEGELSGF